MRTKRVGIAAFVGALALTVAACGSMDRGTEETATEEVVATEGGSTYVAIISKGFQHQFWQAVQKGAEDTAASLGVDFTYEGPENESQVDKQMEQLEAALAKNPSALCFAALDSKAAIPLLEKAKAAGIPVIAFDSGVDSDIPITTAATDSVASAALAADKMVELIGGSGKVAIVAQDQTSRTGIDRVAGFKDQIESEYPKVTSVDIQ